MNGNIWATILPLVILIAVMYFLLIRPQKKREKEVNAMRSGVQVGDEIITIGGICGKVVKTKEDSLVIQVGADRGSCRRREINFCTDSLREQDKWREKLL